MNVREYAAQLLSLPDDALDLQVIISTCGYDYAAEGPEINETVPSERKYLRSGTPLSEDDFARVVTLG